MQSLAKWAAMIERGARLTSVSCSQANCSWAAARCTRAAERWAAAANTAAD